MTSCLPTTIKSNPLFQQKSRVTLIGDAAHKTTTQAGLGAWAAITDACTMAACVNYDVFEWVKKYEKKGNKYHVSAVSMSHGNTMRLHENESVMINWLMYFIGCLIWGYQSIRGY